METGLRFGSTAKVPVTATPQEQLEWWQQAVNQLYHDNPKSTTDPVEIPDHPTLRLLQHVFPPSQSSTTATTQTHLNNVLQGRRNDLTTTQYSTLQQLEDHAALSCGSLSQLVLESGNMTEERNPQAHQAARLVGIGHGLTNALRTSIPVISATGKLIVLHKGDVLFLVDKALFTHHAIAIAQHVFTFALAVTKAYDIAIDCRA